MGRNVSRRRHWRKWELTRLGFRTLIVVGVLALILLTIWWANTIYGWTNSWGSAIGFTFLSYLFIFMFTGLFIWGSDID